MPVTRPRPREGCGSVGKVVCSWNTQRGQMERRYRGRSARFGLSLGEGKGRVGLCWFTGISGSILDVSECLRLLRRAGEAGAAPGAERDIRSPVPYGRAQEQGAGARSRGAELQLRGGSSRERPSGLTAALSLQSGLTKAVKESKISLQQAEYEFLSFVRQQTPPGLCPLAGKV